MCNIKNTVIITITTHHKCGKKEILNFSIETPKINKTNNCSQKKEENKPNYLIKIFNFLKKVPR